MRRVVISGIGVVAPNGVGKEAFWKGCVDGHSGIGPIRSFDASNHPIRVAGEVHDFDPEPFIPAQFRKSVKVMGRAARFGIGAAGLAINDSGLGPQALDPERFGVVMGAGLVPMDLGELAPLLARACPDGGEFDAKRLPDPNRPDSPLFPLWLLKYLPNMAAAHISM